jgi:hypothetical protein
VYFDLPLDATPLYEVCQLCAAHSRLRLHAFIADKNPKGANDGEKCNAFLRPCWSWPAAATHGSLSGGAVTGMLGDSLLLHLDRADYPWRYADADIASVAYIAGGVDEADVGQFPCQKTYRGRKKSH